MSKKIRRTLAYIFKHLSEVVAEYLKQFNGSQPLTITYALAKSLDNYQVYGNSIGGNGTTETPVPIESCGDTLLPSEYQQVEYLESSGQQYIDTGVQYYTFNLGVKSDFELIEKLQTDNLLFGIISSSNYNGGYNYAFEIATSENVACDSKGYRAWTPVLNTNTKYNLLFNYTGTREVYIDNILKFTMTISDRAYVNRNIFLFGANYINRFGLSARWRIYNLTMYDGTTEIRNFIPCYRKSDNKPGMYDTVTNQFFTNANTSATTDFTVGSNITQYKLPVQASTNPSYAFLPEEYQQVEYLESDSNQWINTNFIPSKDDLKVVFKVQKVKNPIDSVMFGQYSANNKTLNVNLYNYESVYPRFLGSNTEEYYVIGFKTQPITFELTKSYINANGSFLGEITPASGATFAGNDGKVALFARAEDANVTTVSYPGAFKLYYWQAIENNIVVANFIPCYRKSDNKPGMYDTVTKTFYTNANTSATTDFTVGADINPTSTANIVIQNPLRKVTTTEVAGLPSEYMQVEYLQSSGEQYIDTGCYPNQNLSFKLKVEKMNVTLANFYGVYESGRFITFWSLNSGNNVRFGDTFVAIENIPLGTIEILHNKTKVTCNSIDYLYNPQTSDFQTSYTLFLFAANQNNNAGFKATCKMYYFSIYESDILLRNFIPCYRKSDNKPGMYDLVSKQFFTNANTSATTDFTVGPVIADYIDYTAQKLYRTTAEITSYNGETITTPYISSTGGLDTGAQVIYQLSTPTEEVITIPNLTTAVGTNYMGANTKVIPSHLMANAYVSQI